MDLRGTKLVVLSACQSGVGTIHDTEGVFGLPRAFLLAGAEHVLFSLWEVHDQETKVFMEKFYAHFVEGADIHSAFWNAQDDMRKLFPQHPRKWAGFVLI